MKSIRALENSDYFNEASRNLVVKVIRQAIKDTRNKMVPEFLREDAKVWLESESCKTYCELLGLSHTEIIKRVGVN